MVVNFTFVPVLDDPFGIFNYDNPSVVKLQGLRANLFEAHDATHSANSTEIVMHLKMADEEISNFLQNLTGGQLPDSKTSTPSIVLPSVQKQLSNTSSIFNTGNMAEVMATLKQSDQQLDSSLDDLGRMDSKNSTNGYTQ